MTYYTAGARTDIATIRSQLGEGGPGALKVEQNLRLHRTKGNPPPLSADILSIYPDVVKVTRREIQYVNHSNPQ